jgi:hypothetical protein
VSYVVVEDVAASWEQYSRVATALEGSPDGLIMHAAGPTDEGYRMVGVWESEDAWARFSRELVTSYEPVPHSSRVHRGLHPEHVVYGSNHAATVPSPPNERRER